MAAKLAVKYMKKMGF